jgi:hypothetical protein
MAPLTAAVCHAFDSDEPTADVDDHQLDTGSAGLVAGIARAFEVRAMIQQAVGLIIADTQRTGDAAYLSLRLRAAERGSTLPDTAAAVIAERRW